MPFDKAYKTIYVYHFQHLQWTGKTEFAIYIYLAAMLLVRNIPFQEKSEYIIAQ